MKLRYLMLLIATFLQLELAHANDEPLVTNKNMPAFTRFLEAQPLDPKAKTVRALLLEWEEKSKDVVDVVCPGVLAPLPGENIKYSGELLAQFIFGSAAHQLENPADKGKLMPAQMAGMLSMLRAYQSFFDQDSGAHIPRLDELSVAKIDGTLESVMTPLVEKQCK